MEYFIEGLLSKAIAEVSEGAIGGGFEEVEAAEETKSGIITKG